MHLKSCKPPVQLFDSTRTSPSGNFLEFAGVVIVSTIMLIVLNIIAAARRSGHLAADGIAAG
jgi:hypothetical protein